MLLLKQSFKIFRKIITERKNISSAAAAVRAVCRRKLWRRQQRQWRKLLRQLSVVSCGAIVAAAVTAAMAETVAAALYRQLLSSCGSSCGGGEGELARGTGK
jgi:hypothetical protein